jgi:alpha-amylase/alpha-mannosidase (GH57 family)
LNKDDKEFILQNFFSINKDKVIATFPRYFELFLKKHRGQEFSTQDYLDLQVYFNLAWIDPSFRNNIAELRKSVPKKGSSGKRIKR